MSVDYRMAEHLGEEDLARLLDDEVHAEERLEWEGHLESCDDCSHRLEELGDVAQWLHEHVAVLDDGLAPNDLARARALTSIRARARPSKGVSRYGGNAVRIAAMIAVLLTAGFSVRPVRAWISDHVERIVGRFETAPLIDLPESTLDAQGALVTFSPTEAVFRLELGNPQATGVLTIELLEVEQASAQVVAGDGETLAVFPAGLWIENQPGSSASYRVQLPAGFIRAVVVIAADEVIATPAIEGVPQTIVLRLATDAPTP